MNLKQKVSVLSATVLPVLALGVYILVTPVKASATDMCTGDEVYAPGGPGGTGCADGHSGGVSVGQHDLFVFCSDGNGFGNGPGVCASEGCVACDYGPF